MFREIRRNKGQILSQDECVEILKKSTSGVLSVLGDDDYPYGVPLSYAYEDNRIYFHCAPTGHKMDSIKKHGKVSFTVIETDNVAPKEYTTYFRSVIAFGKAHVIDNPDEKRQVLLKLVEKYSPDYVEESHKTIERSLNAVGIFYMETEHLSGKKAVELA